MSAGQDETKEPPTSPEAWVEQYGDYLFRYARNRIHRRDVAEDLVQETFLAALRTRETFQARSSEKTWLLGILRHKIIDTIRRMSREHSRESELSPDDVSENLFDEAGKWAITPSRWDTDPLNVLERKTFWEKLMQCVKELPGRMAHAFALRHLEELDGKEAARILKVSSTNLDVLLYRARQRLRLCLEKNWLQ